MTKIEKILLTIVLLPQLVLASEVSTPSSSENPIDKQDISSFEINSDHLNLSSIVQLFEVVKSNSKKIKLYVPRFRVDELKLLAPDAKLLKASIYKGSPSKNSNSNGFIKGYRNQKEVNLFLYGLQEKFPELVKVEVYGKSVKGHDLISVKISDNVHLDEDEPELLITAATHGDELITTESLIRYLENFTSKMKSDHRTMAMVNDHELYFIPIVNPDGFVKKRRYTADGTDPNREYPYPEKPNKESVKCIKEEIKFFHSRKFVATMDLHAHGKMIMYPWGYTKDEVPAADKNLFESLGRDMAAHNKYKVGQISRIIYVAPASSADYYYWKTGAISFGIELGTSKIPWSGKINKVTLDATEMINIFIERF